MVKALMKCSGTDWDKEDASEDAGDEGGEGEEGSDSRDMVLMLRSKASGTGSSLGSLLTLSKERLSGAGDVGNTVGRYLW